MNHLNPALSKTKRILEHSSRKQVKLAQSKDIFPHSNSFSLQCKYQPIKTKNKEESTETQALKNTIFRMAMEITQLKNNNSNLQTSLKQAQSMEEYYLKELQQRKKQILLLEDIITLSKISDNGVDSQTQIGAKSHFQYYTNSFPISESKTIFECGSKVQVLKEKFHNKENIRQKRNSEIKKL